MSKYNISFCRNNIVRHGYEVQQKLWVEEFKDSCDIEVYGCLGRCVLCKQGPYMLVNDEFVGASSVAELYEEIKKLK